MRRARPAFLVALLAQTSGAFQVHRVEQFALATNDVAEEQLWIMADTATMAGAAADDVFLIANTAAIAGDAGNDVWIAGNSITISGTVRDHARVGGNAVKVSGIVSNSLTAVGVAIQITTSAVIRGGANIMANSATVEGRIGGRVRIMAEQATVAGTCDGDVRIVANDIVVTPGAEIGGDLTYTSAKELILDPKVTLRGKLIRAAAGPAAATEVPLWRAAAGQLVFLLGALLAGLVFTGIFPRFAAASAGAIRESPLRCAFTGALGFCLIPMLATAAMFTLIGIPLSLLMLAGFGLLLYLGRIVVALWIGGLLLGKPGGALKRAFALALGLAVLYGVALAPALGTPVWFLVAFVGMGALLLRLVEAQRARPPAAPPDLPEA